MPGPHVPLVLTCTAGVVVVATEDEDFVTEVPGFVVEVVAFEDDVEIFVVEVVCDVVEVVAFEDDVDVEEDDDDLKTRYLVATTHLSKKSAD